MWVYTIQLEIKNIPMHIPDTNSSTSSAVYVAY